MKQKKTKRDWDALMERIKEELPMAYFTAKTFYMVILFIKVCFWVFVVPTVSLAMPLFLLFSALNGFRFANEWLNLAFALALIATLINFLMGIEDIDDMDWMR
jgi:hypothetical protein